MTDISLSSQASHPISYSDDIAERTEFTTCYMCACRCGIKVHLDGDQIRYIEGNPDHPVNQGVLCGKGSAGIMQHNSPARLKKPLKRVGERGAGEFKEIEWDEAIDTAISWLAQIRATSPQKLAFFTGRDQSQALTSWWAREFGTPNYAAHGGFCSVNMAAAGIYTMGSAFWEFSEPDWELTRYLMIFGVAEDHDSNPIKAGIGKLKERRAKFVSVNPIRTGYSAVADEWIGITPGSDGLFVLALVHELLRAGKVDADYLIRYTNAGYLVIDDPGAPDDGLFARGGEGEALSWDTRSNAAAGAHDAAVRPALRGEFSLPGGQRARPVFHLLAERYLDPGHGPDAVAEATGVSAATIRRIAAELAQAAFEEEVVIDQPWTDWQGRRHDKMIGRPVAMHAMRGISAHANGYQTCRAIHILQILLGSVEVPGGMRFKPPYPKGFESLPKPSGWHDEVKPHSPLPGPHLGFPTAPEDLLIDGEGAPQRIDKAFSWEAPFAVHGMMHTVINNAWRGDPYEIDLLFMYMANMAWNSSMNTAETMRMLTDKDAETGEYRIPKIIYSDAYYSEMVAYADLILPDTTYLERWDCISLLDRPISDADGAADSIRHPVVKPDRDVRPFQDVLIDIGARMGFPAFSGEDGKPRFPGGYSDYITNHQRQPGIGPLAGWRGGDGSKTGYGEPNPEQLDRYKENMGFWRRELTPEQRYFKHANRDYLDFAAEMGFVSEAAPIIFQLYSEPMQKFRLAARGHGPVQPPDHLRGRVETYFDPLPFWYQPFDQAAAPAQKFPLHALTQRPMAMYHSWGTQNAWLRQIHGSNRLYIPRALADEMSLEDGDWVYLSSRVGRIKVRVKPSDGVNAGTVWTWNAIGKRAGAWNIAPDAKEMTEGFLLNHLIGDMLPNENDGGRLSNSDPITGQAAWFDLKVALEKAPPGDEMAEPRFETIGAPPGLPRRTPVLRYGAGFKAKRSGR
ncbi:MAG: molybdopterin oxidoreductase family protein [Rhodospirillales bacterium]|jgi:anaerobic selenocysteine-containing dehydrogenase|nr:molybdopterin oxidoreductase family protein [Rhodospirillales bacterium]MDP6643919.1 molybdopterin oxidoreductase family protein [Rhodospirillales bacterium]MDP6841353.1 molybdopterin oxidoreductase family protein [Rhodospirillales bacterium]